MSETLVVVSKVKNYIKNKAGMSTASNAVEALTRVVEKACDEAIERAEKARRKTVMDRDFEE